MISETPEKSYVDPHDYPRDVICEMANNVMWNSGGTATIHFKFTCPHCGERCTFEEPNKLFELGECFKCGANEPVFRAGYMVKFTFGKERQ